MNEHIFQLPPIRFAPVLIKAKETYRIWHNNLANLNRVDRYTIGSRIDDVFLSLLEFIFRACFAFDKFEKISLVSQAIGKNDILRFLLQIGWEQEVIDHNKYGKLLLCLDEVGRMLGGWKNDLQKTPAKK